MKYTRAWVVGVAVVGCSLWFGAGLTAGGDKGKGGKGGGTPPGTVYAKWGGTMQSMDAGGGNVQTLAVIGEPSYGLHGDTRWFLRVTSGELEAVREDGLESVTLTSTADGITALELDRYSSSRWAKDDWTTQSTDEADSFVSYVGDDGTPYSHIYSVDVAWDGSGTPSAASGSTLEIFYGFEHDWSPYGDLVYRGDLDPDPDNDGDGLVDEDPDFGIDNDGDGLIDEDPIDGLDNDGDQLIDEDDPNDDGDGLVDEDGPNASWFVTDFVSSPLPVSISTFDTSATWSPDGGLIAWTQNGGIWIMFPDGSGMTEIVSPKYTRNNDKTYLFEVPWSPDSAMLVCYELCMGVRKCGTGEAIFRFPVSGTGGHKLTDHGLPVAWR